jgi:uncharacterized protein
MRRITGTHVYSYVKCPRLAALDLHVPRSERRAPTEWEAFAAQRGRDFEDQFVAGLAAVRPEHATGDFETGAAATLELLRAGTPWVHQAVLLCDDRLGLPDLLRCLPGASALGDHHYEVLDVKTSGRPRSDQILQVVFYSRLLAELQQRAPSHGALVLKDGREERFLLADYDAAGREVEAALRQLRETPDRAQPFLQAGCASCYHDQRCLGELRARGDLSLVAGMTHGAQAILTRLGVRTVAELAQFHPDGARQRGNLEAALVRRLRKAAQACLSGKPIVEERPRRERLAEGAILHLVADAFADRVLAVGLLYPAREDGTFAWRQPRAAAEEWAALKDLLYEVPDDAPLLHFGGALPHWYTQHAFEREADASLEARLVDLEPRLRTAATYPSPVFGLADYVRHGLGRDPWRAGHAGAAALWASAPDGQAKLAAKVRADLQDLAALVDHVLEGEVVAAPVATAPAAAAPRAAAPDLLAAEDA